MFAENRFLSEFSTFGIGGPIRHFAEVKTLEQMREAFDFAKKKQLPILLLGKGSNCLFDDSGFSGIALLNRIDFCRWEETKVEVSSGYSFSLLGVQSARRHLSGLEFASGIPASVGGAIFMNAGASGSDVSRCLESVTYMHIDGDIRTYRKGEFGFGYRASAFQKMQGAILSAEFVLAPQDSAREKQLQIIEYRKKTQPLKEKSIGCIFRNPSDTVGAGFLIDQCGLKGMREGGAKISEMHANFIVNDANASADDVKKLIGKVQQEVFAKTGTHLEPEVRIIPYA